MLSSAILNLMAVRPQSRKRKDWRSSQGREYSIAARYSRKWIPTAILARHPGLCLVDEFAHTNVPGSSRNKRWEDIEQLRDAGIDVLTTMNVQHLESLNDQVWQITGIRVRETVPDWVVQQADEVVIIDLSPRALLHRLERGVIYERDKVERALQNFFRESTLAALRELALRETAHEIEHRVIKGGSRFGSERNRSETGPGSQNSAVGNGRSQYRRCLFDGPNASPIFSGQSALPRRYRPRTI